MQLTFGMAPVGLICTHLGVILCCLPALQAKSFISHFPHLKSEIIYTLFFFVVAQLCPTLGDPMGCSPPSSSWNSPGRNIGVGCHSLLQGIFPTQGSNPGLLH